MVWELGDGSIGREQFIGGLHAHSGMCVGESLWVVARIDGMAMPFSPLRPKTLIFIPFSDRFIEINIIVLYYYFI